MKDELLKDWRFKACQTDLFDIDYAQTYFK